MPCSIQYFVWFMPADGKLFLFLKVFISPLILKGIFTGSQFFCLAFIFLKVTKDIILLSSYLHCFYWEAINHPNFCSFNGYSIFLATFMIFPFVFDSLQGYYYASLHEFLFILFGISWTSSIYGSMSFISSEKSSVVSSEVASEHIHFSFPSGIPSKHLLDLTPSHLNFPSFLLPVQPYG